MAILQGDVKRITYRDETSHYTVAKLEVDKPAGTRPVFGQPLEVTIVGHFSSLAPGEWLEVEGEWYVHAEFGKQFKVTRYRKAPPSTARGIERYLASGAAPGIGPKLAERLVAKFGERTLEVIEKEPHRLLEVEGIGAREKKAIAESDPRRAGSARGAGLSPKLRHRPRHGGENLPAIRREDRRSGA